jgi:hypothetical protein
MNAGVFVFRDRGTNSHLSRWRRTVKVFMKSAALAVIYPVENNR